MEAMILMPENLYNKLWAYFDTRSDADGDSQGMYPNEEMKLLTELENCKPSNSFELRGSFNDNAPIVFSSEKDMDEFLKKNKP